jgi:hypothetical protein
LANLSFPLDMVRKALWHMWHSRLPSTQSPPLALTPIFQLVLLLSPRVPSPQEGCYRKVNTAISVLASSEKTIKARHKM